MSHQDFAASSSSNQRKSHRHHKHKQHHHHQNKHHNDIDPMPTYREILSSKDEKWQAMATAGLITEKQQAYISRYDKQTDQAKRSLLKEDGAEYALVFADMIHRISTVHTLEYLVSLVDELLEFSESNVKYFIDLHSSSTPELPLYPFFALMDRRDVSSFIKFTSAKILALLMSRATWKVDGHSVNRIVKWFTEVVHKEHLIQDELLRALCVIQDILRRDEFRAIFASEDGINILGNILKQKKGAIQIQYQTLYCLWLLSYNHTISSKLFSQTSIIDKIVDTLKSTTTDKVIRTGIAALSNLVDKNQANNQQMIDRGFFKVLQALNHRKWGDQDVVKDLEKLHDALQQDVLKLSSFEAYRQELTSGDLCWSPVHTSYSFWKENVTKFEENKCAVLGLLVSVIMQSDDPEVLSIALHDIGEFSRHHPRGRKIMTRFPNVKQRIMELLESTVDKIRTAALLSFQKMMVQNWEYLDSYEKAEKEVYFSKKATTTTD